MDGIVQNPDGTNGLWNKGKLTDIAIKNFLEKKGRLCRINCPFLSEEFDFGPVLARCFEKILPNDTVENLYSRLKKKRKSNLC